MEHYLKIAEMLATREHLVLKTVVGSCIALCLWDKKNIISGMVHIMMPWSNGSNQKEAGKYADSAVECLMDKMLEQGANLKTIIAKIAGGSSMFCSDLNTNDMCCGKENAKVVKQYLKKYNIPIEFEHLHGNKGRHITFQCATGEMEVRTLNNLIKSRDMQYV